MNLAGKFAPKARIVKLASVSLRDERRQAFALRQSLSERHVNAFRCSGRLEALNDGGRHVFATKWTAVGGAFGESSARSLSTGPDAGKTMRATISGSELCGNVVISTGTRK